MKDAYSIYETKTHLSQLLKKVKAGFNFIISERGTPIAEVIPVKKEMDFKERLDHLKSIGLIRPSKKTKLPTKSVKILGALDRFLEDR